MATSVKKGRSRRTSWLSPMWRDIDSLRKQNESTKKEIESMRRKSKQTETETEQLRSETEILRRQNKALELIESNDLNALCREATIVGGNDSEHPEAQLDLDLLADKFVALGCDADDIPFLFGVLELTKGKELVVPRKISLSASEIQSQANRRNNFWIKRDWRDLKNLLEFRTKIGPATSFASNTRYILSISTLSLHRKARVETQWLRRAGQR